MVYNRDLDNFAKLLLESLWIGESELTTTLFDSKDLVVKVFAPIIAKSPILMFGPIVELIPKKQHSPIVVDPPIDTPPVIQVCDPILT